MSTLDFIIEIEMGTMSEDDFFDNVQAFVDEGTWRHLQGFWQRAVHNWAEEGYVTL